MFFFPEGSAEGRGEGRWGDKQERVGTWIITREEEQGGKTRLVVTRGEEGWEVGEKGEGNQTYADGW